MNPLREAFAEALRARKLSSSTIDLYLGAVDRFLCLHEDIDVRAIGRREIDAYYGKLEADRISEATRSIRMRGLRRFFDYLVETQRIFTSPMSHYREHRVHSPLGKTLSESEAEKLLSMPNTSLPAGTRDRALLEVLYATGLRCMEVINLEVFDVDLAGGLIRVREGKGGKDRFVPLSTEAQKWLGEYLKEIRPRMARHGEVESRSLFVNRSGQRLTNGAITQVLLKYGKAAGLGRVSSHMVRRTVATALLRGGADIATVAELLGHESIQTTVRYAQLAANDVRVAHAKSHPRGDARGDDGQAAR